MNKRGFLTASLLLTLAGCASRLNRDVPRVESPESLSKRQDIVMQSMAMLDRSYTYGGKKLHTGFDCSGLVSFVYRESAHIPLKGNAATLAQSTRPIDPQDAQPGDLVFFNTLGSAYSHVGIYSGEGKFIHAANEKTGIKQEKLNHPYWSKRFQGYRTAFK
jgi:cell wall-associated NlpC family hydrolase